MPRAAVGVSRDDGGWALACSFAPGRLIVTLGGAPVYERGIEFADTMTHDCPTCGEPTSFEQVPAPGGPAASSAEWACTACGAALVIDPVLPREPSVQASRTRAA